jgi:DNA-binding beta-propeller fold protein YncE
LDLTHFTQVFDSASGVSLRQFGTDPKLKNPNSWYRDPRKSCGLALDRAGNLVLTKMVTFDHQEHCVSVFRPDGTLLWSFGSQGTGDSQFESPTGVSVDQHGHIFVCDTDNHRVSVFAV